MRIQGEAYLFMNVWMNFFSLMLAFRLARRPLRMKRGLAAALLGACYGAAAALWPSLRGPVCLAAAALGMGLGAGGGFGVCPLIFAGGWMLSGLMDFFLGRGMGPWGAMLLAGMGAFAFCRLLERLIPRGGGAFRLVIRIRGQSMMLPALRDSGNLLTDPVTGLPVIVAPKGLLPGLAPEWAAGWGPGCRLLPIRTASGRGMACCLHPEEIWICRGTKRWRTDAILALSDFQGPGALLPGRLFMQTEEGLDAGL
ncbi:MAG: sigma-E processing peptidase SpoIIGA [Clostridia bacterium]|nr:sigma-E processing peptidase SpoIIGA [Clostridia bacterium]